METADMKAQTSEVVRLFPTFVCKTQLGKTTYEPINQTIRAQLPQWPGTSAGGAWQSGPGLHKLGSLRALIACIDTEVYSVLDFSISFNVMFAEYEKRMSLNVLPATPFRAASTGLR